MTTTVNLRKLLHRKSWEMCQPSLGPLSAQNTSNGSFVTSDKFNLIPNSLAFFVNSVNGVFRYDGDEDSWVQLPNSGIAGTFAAGSCGELRALSAMGGVFIQTVTAGGVASLTTNKTIVRNLAGRRLRVVAGTGLGYDGLVVSNTLGANAVITTDGSTTFDATTQFQLFGGSLWFMNAGTVAVGFSVYDLATNAWTARAVANLPTAWGTEGQLVSTIGSAGSFATGTATAGAASTLTNSGKAWGVNMWNNSQIRITGGTGKGQIRPIASNTATVITITGTWAVNPDATSTYSIEGNGDYMYLLGNNAVAMYRFQVSTNTWTVLAPTAARAGAAAAGCSGNWIDSVEGWDNETLVPLYTTVLFKQNGRYIFSFRGGATSTLDVYDIAANTWVSNVLYGNQMETFTTGTSSFDYGGSIYLQKEATGRFLDFELKSFTMRSIAATPLGQGTTVTGQKMFMLPYQDGGTELTFLYTQRHTGSELYRMLLI